MKIKLPLLTIFCTLLNVLLYQQRIHSSDLDLILKNASAPPKHEESEHTECETSFLKFIKDKLETDNPYTAPERLASFVPKILKKLRNELFFIHLLIKL